VTAVSDGDTFRCREREADGRQIRVRLSGVAARERDGSCAPGHPCPDASAESATRELSALAAGRRLDCRQVGDTHARRAAFCSREDGVDLSCAMVESGTTLVWQRHWGDHRCEAPGTA
jgi:endonuclease YncB( thermonuclease family)